MTLDAALMGVLTSISAVAGALVWQLLVRPEDALRYWTDQAVIDEESWFEHHPAALRALRTLGAALLLVLGFMCGFALTLLTQTS